jgi:hypothetical protein
LSWLQKNLPPPQPQHLHDRICTVTGDVCEDGVQLPARLNVKHRVPRYYSILGLLSQHAGCHGHAKHRIWHMICQHCNALYHALLVLHVCPDICGTQYAGVSIIQLCTLYWCVHPSPAGPALSSVSSCLPLASSCHTGLTLHTCTWGKAATEGLNLQSGDISCKADVLPLV